jgi:hypothetical protein
MPFTGTPAKADDSIARAQARLARRSARLERFDPHRMGIGELEVPGDAPRHRHVGPRNPQVRRRLKATRLSG